MRVDNRPGLSTAPANVFHSRIHRSYPQSGRGQCGKSRDSASHLCTARRASCRSGHGSNPSTDASTAVRPAPALMELLLMNLYGFRSTQSPTRRRRVGWARSRSEFGCTLRGVFRRANDQGGYRLYGQAAAHPCFRLEGFPHSDAWRWGWLSSYPQPFPHLASRVIHRLIPSARRTSRVANDHMFHVKPVIRHRSC